LQALPEVRWNVVEQAHYVAAGQEYIQDEQLRFYPSIAECLRENKPTVVVLSSVLQYLRDPQDALACLAVSGANYLMIDRTPFAGLSEHRVMVQQVPPSIYAASYPTWVFAQEKFARNLAHDWRLVAEHLSPEGRVRSECGFEFCFQGALWERCSR
jgi:putative methyltransferase (TIGR04325 family)